jgi:GTP-binding protein HflX
VVDGASATRDRQIEDVNKVLAEIGAAEVPQVLVWNKIDLSGVAAGVDRNECGNIERVRLSARTGDGLDGLRQALIEAAASRHQSRTDAIPATQDRDVHVT